MTDQELMLLAAKAMGYEPEDRIIENGWNPLTDDGDALRLAVKLKMTVDVDLYGPLVQVRAYNEPSMYHIDETGEDPYAATRRAIVRAAAEVGREMK